MLFVCSGPSREVSCLMEDFFVRDEVAYPPKDSDASTLVHLPASEQVEHSACENAYTNSVAPPSRVSVMDINDDGYPPM